MERLTMYYKESEEPYLSCERCGKTGISECWTQENCTQTAVDRLASIEDILGDEYDLDRLRELAQADREGRCVVLNMPRKPLVWGDDDQNTCLCPYCGKDLMGIPYGGRMVLQCPECGQLVSWKLKKWNKAFQDLYDELEEDMERWKE